MKSKKTNSASVKMRSVLKRMMMRSKKMKNKSLNIRARTINNKMQIRKSNLK